MSAGMSLVVEASWVHDPQALASLLADTCHSVHAPAVLRRPAGHAVQPCTLDIAVGDLNSQGTGKLVLQSSARMCELHVQRHGDKEPCYHSTIKGQLLDGSDHGPYTHMTVDLQGAAGWQRVRLRLLSLLGDKSQCSLFSLRLQEGASREGGDGSVESGSTQAVQTGGVGATYASMSQLDELKLLVQHAAGGGGATDTCGLPASLTLLAGKLSQAPTPQSAAIKSFASALAHGVLQQQQKKQQQQQQQQQEQTCGQQAHPSPGLPSLSTADQNTAVLAALERLTLQVTGMEVRLQSVVNDLGQRITALEHAVHQQGQPQRQQP